MTFTHTSPGTSPDTSIDTSATTQDRGRIPRAAHTSLPWRIHEIAHDFDVEDVWALPTPGGPHDFDRLLERIARSGPPEERGIVVRLLWATRCKLGQWFGWDDQGIGSRADSDSLRDRLPADLRDGPSGPELGDVPFMSLYLLPDEWATEIVNRTVHGVLHFGWVAEPGGGHRGQMAVLVKPNGLLGRMYLLAIKPFRYLFIYPALIRGFERDWKDAA